MNRTQLQDKLDVGSRAHFIKKYLGPALGLGLIEMTLPGTPKGQNQRYRLTALGKALAKESKGRSAAQ